MTFFLLQQTVLKTRSVLRPIIGKVFESTATYGYQDCLYFAHASIKWPGSAARSLRREAIRQKAGCQAGQKEEVIEGKIMCG